MTPLLIVLVSALVTVLYLLAGIAVVRAIIDRSRTRWNPDDADASAAGAAVLFWPFALLVAGWIYVGRRLIESSRR